MTRLAGAAWLGLSLLACGPPPPRWGGERVWDKADFDRSVEDAAFAQGRLWLRTANGKLASLAEAAPSPRWEPLPGPALGLCVQDGKPLVASCASPDCDEWTVLQGDDAGFRRLATVGSRGDFFAGLGCTERGALLLSKRRLVEVTREGQREVRLSKELQGGRVTSIQATSHGLLVGLEMGEWGGGLRRIDTRTGELRIVDRVSTNTVCSGPLNHHCDPVMSIEPLPWKPACVAVAVAQLHIIPRGRIVQVCGDDVQLLYERERELHPSIAAAINANAKSAVAFFSFAPANGAMLAAGLDGLYRVDKSGTTFVGPYPPADMRGPFGLSFAVPGVVLVARHGPSSWGQQDGPLLVAR